MRLESWVEGCVAGRTPREGSPTTRLSLYSAYSIRPLLHFTPTDPQQKSPPDGGPGTAWTLLTSRMRSPGTLMVPATLEKLPEALRVWPKLLL